MATTRVLHTIDRVKRAWADMDYAQRRLMEVRTGISLGTASRGTRRTGSAGRLEQLH